MTDGLITPQLADIPIVQSEGLKLIKNTKGYNWEIRLLEINIERLAELNAQMVEKFGGAE